MARSARNTKLETRTARLKLPAGKRYWTTVTRGVALGYRRGPTGGAWYLRRALAGNRYAIEVIGTADDHVDAQPGGAMSFFDAQEAVRKKAADKVQVEGRYTVADAAADYLSWHQAHGKGHETTAATIKAHVLPHFGLKRVEKVTTADIARWHAELATAPVRRRGKEIAVDLDDPDVMRRRRSSANRILTVLRALLNHAWRHGKINDNTPWRRVRPFVGVDAARKVFLQPDQCTRLINATQGQFRDYVKACLYTGARPGVELEHVRVQDFDQDSGTLRIPVGKTGARDTFLSDEAVEFFRRLVAGRAPDEILLLKDDGTPWGKNHTRRLMQRAIEQAKLPKETTIYCLRHTFISAALKGGAHIKVVADSVGTSLKMIEQHYAKFLPTDRRQMMTDALPSLGVERDNVRTLSKRGAK